MLWNEDIFYVPAPFELEADLEDAVKQVTEPLFGPDRIYIDVKKLIKRQSGKGNIPDGYLIDLTSVREPRLYVVENELARHEPLKHIAVQILEFSLAYQTSSRRIKEIIKDALQEDAAAFQKCKSYAEQNHFENVDLLLEEMIYRPKSFSALIIIDEVSEDLERALLSQFRFPVEIVTLRRFETDKGKYIFEFDPFLADVVEAQRPADSPRRKPSLDPSEIDTIVVPAKDEGFEEVFLGENRWYQIRIHSSMIPRIKYIAGYRVAPTSAITHVAEVASIEPWPNSNKYVVNFTSPARKIEPLKLKSDGRTKAPQAPRYTSFAKIESASDLDGAFDS